MRGRAVGMSFLGSSSILLCLAFGSACQNGPEPPPLQAALSQREQQMAADEDPPPEEASAQEAPIQPLEPQSRLDADVYRALREQIPDPVSARQHLQQRLDALRPQEDLRQKAEADYILNSLSYINQIDRENKIELSLHESIQRALEGSYNIRVQSYNPAIAATFVVEAEAAFDTIFFSNATFRKSNSPTATTLAATDSTNRFFNTGIRKLLPTGMGVEVAWNVTRQEFDSDFAFSTLNPSYRNELAFQVRQPFLRGFGIDFNRAQINVFKNDRQVSRYQFERSVQDHLLQVEEAYWRLVAARRSLVIESRLITDFQKIYDYLKAREDYDATQVEITQSKARLDMQVAGFVRVRQDVADTEDNLRALLNDPELNLADDIEIVPTEIPTAEPIVLDRLAELQAALDNRQELHEAELAIESAKINVGTAKNLAMPRFDVTFTYTYDALGKSQHDAFQNLGHFDFHNYMVRLEFEWPIGNRGARAALRRAGNQHAQALAGLKLQIEGIIREVNLAIRELNTSYEQIGANLTSVESQIEEVRAIEERAERRDPDQLFRELSARQSLSSARQSLLGSLLNYNFSVPRLERTKGTLLHYDNVVVGDWQNDQ